MSRSAVASIATYIEEQWEFGPRPDLDTSVMARLIATYARSGNWLDLGCGPMLAAWPMFHNGTLRIHGIDRNPEIAEFHERLRSDVGAELPSSLLAILRHAQSFRAKWSMQPMSAPPLRDIAAVVTGDVLRCVPEWRRVFDTVLQIGCFGCLASMEELGSALAVTREYLSSDGVFISATWVPKPTYSESALWGGDKLRALNFTRS